MRELRKRRRSCAVRIWIWISSGSELNRILSDLRGNYKVSELALAETERSIKRVMALELKEAAACQRPLEGQRDLLINKYEKSATFAKEEKEKLAASISAQTEKIEEVTRSRSILRAAFGELNAEKGRRSALQADLKSLAMQMHESHTEIKEISAENRGPGNGQLRIREALPG